MTMANKYKKKLIEVALPLEAINRAAEYEKLPGIGPHPRGIHLWWARRPQGTCRAILFSQLVDDPSSHPKKFPNKTDQEVERQRLLEIAGKLADWKNNSNRELMTQASEEIKKYCDISEIYVVDPFAGGGSIPTEAQRLGLNVRCSDLNPVAVTIGKAMYGFPSSFSGGAPVHPGPKNSMQGEGLMGLSEDLVFYGEQIIEGAKKKIGKLYPKVQLPKAYGGGEGVVIAWLWARTVPSPDPALNGLAIPLVRSFELARKKGRRAWVEPIIKNGDYKFEVRMESAGDVGSPPKGTASKSGARCIVSGSAIPLDYVREQARLGRMGKELLALVVQTSKGKIYLSPEYAPKIDETNFSIAEMPDTLLPEKALGFRVQQYGMNTHCSLFTKRQLIALDTLSQLVNDVRGAIEKDAIQAGLSQDKTTLANGGNGAYAYSEALSIYLAFSIDRAADFNNSLVGWRPGNEKIMYLFSRQAIPISWDFGEANILEDVVGGFPAIVKYQSKCIATLPANKIGECIQADAAQLEYTGKEVISTDPPYYDNIGYADLSDFFYVWLRRIAKPIFPELFVTLLTPKSEELVAEPFRHGNAEKAGQFFLNGMKTALKRMANGAHPDFPATIYYAFKQSEITTEGTSSQGWVAFLDAVIQAGYSIVGTWPVRTESSTRLRASGSNALSSSVVLVCRKRESDAETITRAEFVRALKQELPPAIHELQKANITPVDMPQASIGPGIGVYSRYKTVLESDDSLMSVKTALQIINRELDAFLTEQEGEFDSDTRFAVTWFEQNGMEAGNFGDADNLARARGLSVDSVKHAGIVESTAGKVRLLARDELEEDWTPTGDTHLTIWECTQYLIRALQDEGEYSAAVLLKQMGPENADAARDLAYRLFDICDKKGQAKESGPYNSLIAVWSDLTARAATISDGELGQEQLSMI